MSEKPNGPMERGTGPVGAAAQSSDRTDGAGADRRLSPDAVADGAVPSAAAETRTADPERDFDEMIRGAYKEQFDRRVQKILEGRLRTLKESHEQHRQAAERSQQAEMACLAALERSAPEIRKVYPDFNWQKEMRSARFARLIGAGVDGRTAYEATHRDEVMGRAMRYGAQRAGEVFSASVASGGRVAENGGGGGSAVSRIDPKALTGRELADIRRRVMRGEKIRL